MNLVFKLRNCLIQVGRQELNFVVILIDPCLTFPCFKLSCRLIRSTGVDFGKGLAQEGFGPMLRSIQR